jgi:translation initiation factor eIF-2B subunit epsilon
VISEGSSDEESDSNEPTTLEIFSKEVAQTLERAFSEGHTIEIASLELNTLRMASNTTFRDTRIVVIPSILGQINTDKLLASTKDVSRIFQLMSFYYYFYVLNIITIRY